MRSALLLAALAATLSACADDAAPATTDASVAPAPARPPRTDPAAAPEPPAAAPAAQPVAVFWQQFQAAVATGRDEAVLPFYHFPLTVAGETVARGDYAGSLASGVWGDESFQAALAALTLADLTPDGDGYRFTATVATGETESAVVGWIAPGPDGSWKVTRLDLAG